MVIEQTVPAIDCRHENESEIVNIAVKLSWLERPCVFLSSLSPLSLTCPFERHPHHSRIETRTPIGPDVSRASPDPAFGVNRSRFVCRPLRKHVLQLTHAEIKRPLDPRK